jgi:hypothetical protein
MPREAQLALFARNCRVDSNALTGTRAVGDDGSKLVTKHKRTRKLRIADAALAVPVQVGAADADRCDFQKHFARPGDRSFFLVEAHVADAVETCCEHRD